MTYRIEGLQADQFQPLFAMSDDELAGRRAMRVTANGPGFPCRVSLTQAAPGEMLILTHFVSHDVETPFRTSYAIYVREEAQESPVHEDSVPLLLDAQPLGLRGFDAGEMLRSASLAMPGEADTRIRELLTMPEIASIHAHNAAYGCFMAKVERS